MFSIGSHSLAIPRGGTRSVLFQSHIDYVCVSVCFPNIIFLNIYVCKSVYIYIYRVGSDGLLVIRCAPLPHWAVAYTR